MERKASIRRPTVVEARPILLRFTIGLASFAGLILLVLAFLPLGHLRPEIERRLSARLGLPVHIARLARRPGLMLSPTVTIDGVSVDQPRWAGTGHAIDIAHARFRLPLVAALIGRFHPHDLVIDGMTLRLVRTADGRRNLETGASGGPATPPDGLRIRNGRILYRDAKQSRSLDATFATDDEGRLALAGQGSLRGEPVRIAARGAPVGAKVVPWPFAAAISGPAIHFRVTGHMAHAFNTSDMAIDIATRAKDLKLVDAVIEAGLFQTQPVNLVAHARHEGQSWQITGLAGAIGHSRLAATVRVDTVAGRHQIDGEVRADSLDFADLSSATHQAEQAALKRAGRQKLVPGTKVDLTKLARTDGMIHLIARHMIGSSGPPLQSLDATLTLDHSRLAVDPIRLSLTRGTVTGSVVADQRGRALPLVTIDLALRNSDLDAFSPGQLSGGLTGSLHLAGPGRTLAQAIARSQGGLSLRVSAGQIPARVAAAIGGDAGRALTRAKTDQVALRCAILDTRFASGEARIRRLLIDTGLSQGSVEGGIALPEETIQLRVSGRPKRASLIQLPAGLQVMGTLAKPKVSLAPRDKSAGAIVRSLGRAITGKQPVATDLDCAALGR